MDTQDQGQGMQPRRIHGAEAANDTPAVTPPIFQTSTYRLATPEEGAALAVEVAPAMFYTRYGSPNVKQVEGMLTALEGAEAALAVGSGMASVSIAILSNVRAGDHVVAQQTHYTSSLSLLHETLPRYGIDVIQGDQRDTSAFE